jgi:hypothetical protein
LTCQQSYRPHDPLRVHRPPRSNAPTPGIRKRCGAAPTAQRRTSLAAAGRLASHLEEPHLPKRPNFMLGRQRIPVGLGLSLPLSTALRPLWFARRQSTRDEWRTFRHFGPSKTAWLSHAPGTIRTCGLCLRGSTPLRSVGAGMSLPALAPTVKLLVAGKLRSSSRSAARSASAVRARGHIGGTSRRNSVPVDGCTRVIALILAVLTRRDCAVRPVELHGKEGVNGSSPLEGSRSCAWLGGSRSFRSASATRLGAPWGHHAPTLHRRQ